jgi:hypothetical protein
MRQARAGVVILMCSAAGVLLGLGCGAQSKPVEISNCAPPRYRFRIGGRSIELGGCNSQLPAKPHNVSVVLGERFSLVDLERGEAVPEPNTAAVRLESIERSENGSRTVNYQARAVGRSDLDTRGDCLGATSPSARRSKCKLLSMAVRLPAR